LYVSVSPRSWLTLTSFPSHQQPCSQTCSWSRRSGSSVQREGDHFKLPSLYHKPSLPLLRPPMYRRVSLPERRPDQETDDPSILTRLLSFTSWTHYYPLRTAERVLHLMFPDTMDHKVKLNYTSDPDENLFRHMTFSPCDPHQTTREDEDFASYPPSLIIAIQPPWILSPRDLESFVGTHKVFMCHNFLCRLS
jgi:hypothetical protein